jgi:hypothetical protein
MSNLIVELLLRLVKPALATLLGAAVFVAAVGLGAVASAELALVSWLVGAALILLVQESPL